MNTEQWLEKGRRELKGVTPTPLFESQSLLSSLLKVPPAALYLKENQTLKKDLQEEFLKKIQIRKTGRPIAYITGEKEFVKRRFYVGQGVFIPRPETEGVVEEVLKLTDPIKGMDFGTGSGCLALSIALERPQSRFVAVESAPTALPWLRKNLRKWNRNEQVKILHQDVCGITLKNVEPFLKGKPNVIVANPPYVNRNDNQLEDSVRHFEPAEALFSGREGLAHITSWFEKAMELLSPGGVYIFEMGYNQGERVRHFLDEKKILKSYTIQKDLQGWERIALCMKK